MPNETIKIPLYKPIYGEKPLAIKTLKTDEKTGNLLVTVSRIDGDGLDKGMTLTFRRYANRGDRTKVVSGDMTISGVTFDGDLCIIEFDSSPQSERLYPTDTVYQEKIDGEWATVNRELTDAEITDGIKNDTLAIHESPYYSVSNLTGEFLGTAVTFKEDHNIFLQDLDYITLTGYDSADKPIKKDVKVKILREDGYTIADCEDLVIRSADINCKDEETLEETYTYLPENLLTDTILLSKVTEAELKNIAYFKANTNPFYHDGELFGPGCWDAFSAQTVFLNRDYGYWNVPVHITKDIDDNSLGLSDIQGEVMINDEISHNIPPVINMEKIKYVPMFRGEDGKLSLVTEIEINMHFRKRSPLTGETANSISDDSYDKETGNIPFDDGWYIDPDKEKETGWFSRKEGESDLLGYLGFDDNDIFYQKSKIGKSFIRLSYYNNDDPLSQSMLNYSTVFFDTGEIYGKYLRLKDKIDNGVVKWNYAVGLCDKDETESPIRVDSKLTITNEYDRSKCSEGFNIYMFADDAPVITEENSEQTIYMKAEFNHAKVGKTIPLLMDSNENGIAVERYLETLYIPIKIGYNIEQKTYYYRIENAVMDGTKMILTLFEPKLKRG